MKKSSIIKFIAGLIILIIGIVLGTLIHTATAEPNSLGIEDKNNPVEVDAKFLNGCTWYVFVTYDQWGVGLDAEHSKTCNNSKHIE